MWKFESLLPDWIKYKHLITSRKRSMLYYYQRYDIHSHHGSIFSAILLIFENKKLTSSESEWILNWHWIQLFYLSYDLTVVRFIGKIELTIWNWYNRLITNFKHNLFKLLLLHLKSWQNVMYHEIWWCTHISTCPNRWCHLANPNKETRTPL